MRSAREVAFIDPRVSDIDVLLAGLRSDVEPLLLSAERPALAQMATALADRAGLEAVHVIAHGRPGQVSFAGEPLTMASLAAQGEHLAEIGRAAGELLLWSCETAGAESGRVFLAALTEATGARVRAATQMVGAADKGGSWTLDAGAGFAKAPLTAAGIGSYPEVLSPTAPDAPADLADISIVDGVVNVAGDTTGQALTGTAEADALISVYDGTTLLGTTTADGSGAWSYTLGHLGDGSYSLMATAANAAGTGAASGALSFTVDATAPDAPALADASIANGFVNAAHDTPDQALTGTAEAGALISVYDGTTLLGTSTADGAGGWSYTLGHLADGTHSLTATATDAAGNTGVASGALSFTVDTTAPDAPTSLADASIVSGVVNAAHDTPDQALTGTAEAGTLISVYDGTTLLGATTADGAGAWSYTLGHLADGSHSLTATATATNAVGNTGPASDALSFTVDATAPDAPAALADASIVNGFVNAAHDTPDQALTGTAEAGALISVYDGTTLLGTATADGAGAWSYTLGHLADGSSHSLTATATDAAGNTGAASGALSFTVDTTAPVSPASLGVASTAAPSANLLTNGGFETGDLSGWTQSGNTDYTTVETSGPEEGTYFLQGGPFGSDGLLTQSFSDTAGQTLTLSAWVTGDGSTPSDVKFIFNGLTVLSIDPVPAQGWTLYSVNVTATGADTFTVGFRNDADYVGLDNFVAAPVASAGQSLTGTAQADAVISVYDGATLLGTTTADGSGTWNYTLGQLATGAHSLTATATDAAGNTGAASGALSFTVATAAPNAPAGLADSSIVAGVVNYASNTASQALTGTADAKAVISVYDGTTLLGTATADGAGAWSYTLGHLTNGAHSLTATATDAAGNTGAASGALTFTVDSAYSIAGTFVAGPAPMSLVVGDFNGDGNPDLATANNTGNNVSILLGDGLGGFGAATNVPVGFQPSSLVVGKFNGDGSLDLAAANAASHTVSILQGGGDGSFTAGSTIAIPAASFGAAVGDLNGDGKLDLVVTHDVNNTVSILLGDGAGGFAPTAASPIPTGGVGPWGVALGDVNGDGKLDIVATNDGSNTVSVLQGDGAGGFTVTGTYATGSHPRAVLLGDLNGDNKLDMIVADRTTGNVMIRLGDGAGGFGPATYVPVGQLPGSMALADLNGDHKLDLVVANQGDNSVSILYGDGSGKFASPETITGLTSAYGVVIGDFNGDGLPDIAVGSASSSSVTLLLHKPPVSPPDAPAGLADASILHGFVNAAHDTPDQALTGTAQAKALISVYDGTTLLGTTTADSSGVWSYTLGQLADGSAHSLTATAANAAGTGVASGALSFTVDTTAPDAPDALADGSIVNTFVNAAHDTPDQALTGTAEAGALISVYDGTTLLGTATANGAGAWSYTLAQLADGAHSLTATATDAAGNTGVASGALSFTVDTTASGSGGAGDAGSGGGGGAGGAGAGGGGAGGGGAGGGGAGGGGASYTFETMTDAQAASFNGARDTLTFSDPNASNTTVKVLYVLTPGDSSHPASTSFVITDTNEALSRTFGPQALPLTATFQNGHLFAGGIGADPLNGSSLNTSDAFFGGPGADTLTAGNGPSCFLQGNAGSDSLVGGTGSDTLFGGADDDVIMVNQSEVGRAFVNGNMGNDTIIDGPGADSLHGGQGDDVIYVGSGADWISGDLGNNTIYGGRGVDTFRAGAGHDQINNWHAGDVVQVASDVSWTASQVGSDVHILFSNGGEMDLMSTQYSSLQSGWLVAV
jgi:hypothetical protein